MEHQLRIMLIEDNQDDVGLVKKELERSGIQFALEIVDTKEEYIRTLPSFNPDIILSDHSLPSFNSLEAFFIARNLFPEIPFILVTGAVSEEFAVECMKAGVDDYILKSSLMRLPSAIRNVFSKKAIKREKEIIESLHQELKIAYDEIQQKNKNITDSIRYAQHIQEAMLPNKKVLTSIFPESFIIYKPKDIISGDFYWFTKQEHLLILVAADCTGHGVPGALMSMIGCNLINELVNIQRISEPGKILELLNKRIRWVLKQDVAENQDGMDAAICVINTANKTIAFSGANLPVIHFHHGQLKVMSGGKHGIGGLQPEHSKEFTECTFTYEAGDTIYLSSDGIPDQFGGVHGKKMMKKNFLALLESVQVHPLALQEELLDQYLRGWQGGYEQTDDMLLIGVRF